MLNTDSIRSVAYISGTIDIDHTEKLFDNKEENCET
jgi:hypothetical protein